MISTKAVLDYLTDGVDIETTIMACTDPADFAVVRTVNGGAVDSFGNYIGKVIRCTTPRVLTDLSTIKQTAIAYPSQQAQSRCSTYQRSRQLILITVITLRWRMSD